MKDTIDVLARLGADAGLAPLSGATMERLLAASALDDVQQAALRDGDADGLARLLGLAAHVGIIMPAEEEEEDGDEEEAPSEAPRGPSSRHPAAND
jgi:hypothetical protein